MVYTVTLNPSLDYIATVNDFKTGQLNRTSGEMVFPGGKGINVSIVLKNLGIETCALGFIAGFTGEEIERLLSNQGITTEFICIDNAMSRINVKLRSDSETEINGQGPHIEKKNIDDLYRILDRLQESDILVLAGSIPAGITNNIYMDIMDYVKHKNIKVVVDTTKELLLNTLKYKPFLIKPNLLELGELFDVNIQDKETAVVYARKLQERGAENVLVSMAKQGAVLLTQDGEVYESPPPDGILVNSIGAGDSMVAGFIKGYIDSHNFKEAFYMGICSGSASAFSEYLATKQEVDRLRSKMK